MGKINTLWFYLEPYVFVSEDIESFLFYNAYTKKGMTFDKNKTISEMVRYLKNPDNMYSTQIGMKELENEALYNMIQSLQNESFGDLIEGSLPKPVIIPPILNLRNKVERLDSDNMYFDNILSYLHEVTVFLNGECTYNCRSCRDMFKQFLCCTKSNDELEFKSLNVFLYSISHTGASVSFTGGNLFLYPNLSELFDVLENMNFSKTFIVNFRNIPEDVEILRIFAKESFLLKIIVNDSYRKNTIIDIAERLQHYNINQLWEVGVTSEREYEKAELLCEQFARYNIKINVKPFYNRKNLTFFEENIFMQKEELLSVALDKREIFTLQELNTYNFGKITLMPNGKIYADVNKEPIGNIKEPIGNVLSKEMISGDSWRYTRYQVEPCNQCCFKLICPSPSGYESVIGKPNLCHVRQ